MSIKKLPSRKSLYGATISLYVLALVQNVIVPLGNTSIVVTGLLSFAGSVSLVIALYHDQIQELARHSLRADSDRPNSSKK